MPAVHSSVRWASRSGRAVQIDDALDRWFRQADRNQDNVLTADEMQADAARFFAKLDTDGNGDIDPEEVINYEWEVAPEIQVNARLRRPGGENSRRARTSNNTEEP